MRLERQDKRRFPRRAKSIRFRFEHEGDVHFAVTTTVSLSGAFLKASHVPRPGTVLVLDERFNSDGVAISMRGEVVWVADRPSLERPDTGFGFRFFELFTKADPGLLEDFLRALDPAFRVATGGEIAYEERASGVHAVFRFPFVDAEPGAYSDEPANTYEPDDPHVVDLDRELERLSREEARMGIPPLPPPPPDPSPVLSSSPDPSGGGRPELRPRSKKRSVTGIFTALFGGAKKSEDQPVGPEHTPALGMDDNTGLLVHDARRPKMMLSWGTRSAVARIESLHRQNATLWTSDAAPDAGEAIVLRPVGTAAGLQLLAIHGVVKSREDRGKGGLSWLSVEFRRVDEQGRVGRFQDYLRLVNGPGADER